MVSYSAESWFTIPAGSRQYDDVLSKLYSSAILQTSFSPLTAWFLNNCRAFSALSNIVFPSTIFSLLALMIPRSNRDGMTSA